MRDWVYKKNMSYKTENWEIPWIWKKSLKEEWKIWEIKEKVLRNEEGGKTEDKNRRKDLLLWGMSK